jgi:hypothetical protein
MGSALQPQPQQGLLFTPPDANTPEYKVESGILLVVQKLLQIAQLAQSRAASKCNSFPAFSSLCLKSCQRCAASTPLVACRRRRRCFCSRRRRRRRRPSCTCCCAILSSGCMVSKSSRLQCGCNCPAPLPSPQGSITPLKCRFGHCKRACILFLLLPIQFDALFQMEAQVANLQVFSAHFHRNSSHHPTRALLQRRDCSSFGGFGFSLRSPPPSNHAEAYSRKRRHHPVMRERVARARHHGIFLCLTRLFQLRFICLQVLDSDCAFCNALSATFRHVQSFVATEIIFHSRFNSAQIR